MIRMYSICLVLVAEQWSWIKVEILFSLCRLLFNSIFRTTPFPSLQSPCLQMVPGVPDYCWFNSSCLGDSVGLTTRNGVGNLEVLDSGESDAFVKTSSQSSYFLIAIPAFRGPPIIL